MILRQGVAIAVVGTAAGALVFAAFATLLRNLMFEVKATDVASLASAVVVVLTVATVATWLPARRSARDLVEALKPD